MASYRKLPSGKWQALVKHQGKQYTRSDPLKGVVREWAEDLETRLRRGELSDPNAGKVTLEEWWGTWSANRKAEVATVAKRESLWRVHLQPTFGATPLRAIQAWDIEVWLSKGSVESGGAEVRVAAFRLLSQLLAEAVRLKKISSNPASIVEPPTAPKHVDRFLDIEEADRLLAAITSPDRAARVPRGEAYPRVPDPAMRLFVQIMLEAGLRWQEVAGLHGFRVDLRRSVLRVQEVARRDRTVKAIPKTSAGQRVVPVADELLPPLSAYLAGRSRDGLLFPADDGRPLDYANWLKRVWAPAVRDAGLARPLPTPHDCRHSYGSWLADQNVPPHEIAALMGHSSLRAVERYIHASEARLQRARSALGARRVHDPGGEGRSPAPSGTGNGA